VAAVREGETVHVESAETKARLRRLAAIESARGSFETAGEVIARTTDQHVGKRQVEQLAQRAAVGGAFQTATTP